MRYTKQRRESDCVPVALINTLKWAGIPASYDRLFEPIARAVFYNPEHGTLLTQYTWRALERLSLGSLVTKQARLRPALYDEVGDGMALLVGHKAWDGVSHLSLLVRGPDGPQVVNGHLAQYSATVQPVSRARFALMCSTPFKDAIKVLKR